MGGQVDATEDMFAKLESMRAVITEVNTQFKDPVRSFHLSIYCVVLNRLCPVYRKRRLLFVSVYLSSSRCMRRNA